MLEKTFCTCWGAGRARTVACYASSLPSVRQTYGGLCARCVVCHDIPISQLALSRCRPLGHHVERTQRGIAASFGHWRHGSIRCPSWEAFGRDSSPWDILEYGKISTGSEDEMVYGRAGLQSIPIWPRPMKPHALDSDAVLENGRLLASEAEEH